jgi:hypothetical protein
MILEAGFVTFFRTLAIIFAVIYFFKFAAKYLLPFLLKRAVRKAQEKTQHPFGKAQDSHYQKGKVGETVIDKKPTNSQRRSNQVGDYVDYEEID